MNNRTGRVSDLKAGKPKTPPGRPPISGGQGHAWPQAGAPPVAETAESQNTPEKPQERTFVALRAGTSRLTPILVLPTTPERAAALAKEPIQRLRWIYGEGSLHFLGKRPHTRQITRHFEPERLSVRAPRASPQSRPRSPRSQPIRAGASPPGGDGQDDATGDGSGGTDDGDGPSRKQLGSNSGPPSDSLIAFVEGLADHCASLFLAGKLSMVFGAPGLDSGEPVSKVDADGGESDE